MTVLDDSPSEAVETACPLRIAYMVSRFPALTETFVLRELTQVDKDPRIAVELFALLPPKDSTTIHEAARPWMSRLHRSGLPCAAFRTAQWALRRPRRMHHILAAIVTDFMRNPGRLVRSLGIVPFACAHATTLQRLGVEHVHAHFAGHPTLAAWIVHELTGIRYSVTAHAYDLFLDQSFLPRGIRGAEFIAAISEYNRRFLAAYGGDQVTPVRVVHCGIAARSYDFKLRDIPSESVKMLSVASLQPHKGLHVLLEALAGPEDDLRRVRLQVVGDGPMRKQLEADVRRLGLSGRVEFCGGQPENEVRRLLDQAHVFVLPSVIGRDGRMEGIPVSLMEALAAGVPVIASRMSGIPELVRDGETGLLAAEGDGDDLRRAILSVLRDPVDARRRAIAGRQLVLDEFSVEDTARDLVELFLQLPSPA